MPRQINSGLVGAKHGHESRHFDNSLVEIQLPSSSIANILSYKFQSD